MDAPSQRSSVSKNDILIAIAFFVLAAVASWWSAGLLDPVILNPETDDAWFEADISRVFSNMTSRSGNHYRVRVHPLFSLATYPPVTALRQLCDLEPAPAVRLFLALVAGFWGGVCFVFLRLMECRRLDAVLFTLLALVSAAAVFWFVVPETYALGSLSVLVALCVVTVSQRRALSEWWYVAISAFTLCFTITNWMAGLLATFANCTWRRTVQISANAFCIVAILWGVQKLLMPSASFFIGHVDKAKHILTPESGGPLHVTKAFFFHTMVMPAIAELQRPDRPPLPNMTVQLSAPGSASLWGAIAIGLWSALLLLGLWGLFSAGEHKKVRIVVAGLLLGQLGLHIFYGEETFLFALHFLPLLIALAALSTRTPARPIALCLACLLVLASAINNFSQFNQARRFFPNHGVSTRQVGLGRQVGRALPDDRIVFSGVARPTTVATSR